MGGRLPVDGKKVQEFRITLGTFERDRLDTLISSISANQIASPVVSLMSDTSGMIVFASLLATVGIIVDLEFKGEPTMGDVLNRIREGFAQANIQSIAAKMNNEPGFFDGLLSIFQRGLDIAAGGPADRIPDNVNPNINKDLF
tara:strand:- start:16 stop:444 length:429 start_codon:yes stop_codon:yes gene_type:complete